MSEPLDILLVEDGEDDAVFFTHALKGSDVPARIRIARNGVEALEIIFGKSHVADAVPALAPRLIVLDLKLPKLSGHEVLQRLRANPHTRSIPVVILSSSQEKRDIVESYQFGANSYLVKPMDFDEFPDLIGTLARYWLRYNQTPKS